MSNLKDKEKEAKMNKVNYFKQRTAKELLAHPLFLYARKHTYSFLEPGYKVYWKRDSSPTGVWGVGGVTDAEFEKYGDSRNSVSPTEDLRTGI